MSDCALCEKPGGELVWRDAHCRVVRITGDEAAAFPGFCRVIWQAHVREMSDLAPADRHHLLTVLGATEAAVRAVVSPDKINLASLGNVVPHLHWHVIPRWTDDSHFPAPIWAAALRPVPPRDPPPTRGRLKDALQAALAAAMGDPR
jgi:diadenosine tetraphosphate (Ap4A) HIT family hydrolase